MDDEKKKNRAAVALGKLGGKARMLKLSAEQRSEIARVAGKARQAKKRVPEAEAPAIAELTACAGSQVAPAR